MGSCLKMIIKWIAFLATVILVILLSVYITRQLAKKIVDREAAEMKRDIAQEMGDDAWKTIAEAKRWIEEDNEVKRGGNMVKGINGHTLGELLALEASEEEYEKYVEMVSEVVGELYSDYQFFMYEPDKSDLVSGYMLQFQIMGHEPVYDKLFKYAMDTGLEMDKIDKYFYEALTNEKVIPVGEGIVLEEEGTGISPIKSGDDVRIIISFVTEEYRKRQEEAEAEKDA